MTQISRVALEKSRVKEREREPCNADVPSDVSDKQSERGREPHDADEPRDACCSDEPRDACCSDEPRDASALEPRLVIDGPAADTGAPSVPPVINHFVRF